MDERENDDAEGRETAEEPSSESRLGSLSRRDLLKIGGAGVIGGGAAYAGYTLIDDEKRFDGSTSGFTWDQTFTDTSWVTAAGDDLNVETVTTLQPTGTGSITQAIENAAGQPTVVVFEVGGVIDIERLGTLRVTDSQTWVAGETAPAPGITITGGRFRVSSDKVIVSHMSFLCGDDVSKPENGNAMASDSADVLFDHCTAMWGVDETAGTNGAADRNSFINCIVAESLHDSIHPEGPHSRGFLANEENTELCVMGSLFAHNRRRNPATRSDAVLVNNYVYNPGGLIVHFFGANLEVTAAGLAVEAGADTDPKAAVFQDGGTVYAEDILDGSTPRDLYDRTVTRVTSPTIVPSGLDLQTDVVPSEDVRQFVTNTAGSRPANRPQIEADLVDNRLNRRHGIIDSQDAVGGYPGYSPTRRPLDLQGGGLLAKLRQRRQVVEGGTPSA
ncbi:hypothetical protein [Haloarcula laminariae]|uniref:hypothetical protein n=1 Tax=Haloarcula laminariae TaxID=2961577 RepID=UPI0021CA7158|nr:hypothetical protein [Halomicroarcula laminariae]